MKNILKAWIECDRMKCFEIKALDKRTSTMEWIHFGITIDGQNFRAEHEPFSDNEQKSDKIAYCKTEIDTDFSLDENLCELLDECESAIFHSEFFELNDN